jgi:hypothetical protein
VPIPDPNLRDKRSRIVLDRYRVEQSTVGMSLPSRCRYAIDRCKWSRLAVPRPGRAPRIRHLPGVCTGLPQHRSHRLKPGDAGCSLIDGTGRPPGNQQPSAHFVGVMVRRSPHYVSGKRYDVRPVHVSCTCQPSASICPRRMSAVADPGACAVLPPRRGRGPHRAQSVEPHQRQPGFVDRRLAA